MTKTSRRWVGVPALVTLGLVACDGHLSHGERPAMAPRPFTVVAAFYPLEAAVRSVAKGPIVVIGLTPAGAEPHDLELTPAEISTLQQADEVIYLAGMQPAVDLALTGRIRPALDVLALPGLEPQLVSTGSAAVEGTLRFDPHVWLDPHRFALVARAIAARLGPHGDATAFTARLEALDRELAAGLAPCRQREIVTAHAAFAYLAARYGLRQVAIGGLSPEAEPSPRDLERLVDLARQAKARAVFSETLGSPAVAETLARELSAEVLTLNPLEGLTAEEVARREDYFSVMRSNLAALRKGLECSK